MNRSNNNTPADTNNDSDNNDTDDTENYTDNDADDPDSVAGTFNY